MSDFEEIKRLWLEFYEFPFPSELVGEEVEGICVTSLDSFAAGCIDTFISRQGSLDNQQKIILKNCQKNLEIIVGKLEGEPAAYFEKLLQIVNKIL